MSNDSKAATESLEPVRVSYVVEFMNHVGEWVETFTCGDDEHEFHTQAMEEIESFAPGQYRTIEVTRKVFSMESK